VIALVSVLGQELDLQMVSRQGLVQDDVLQRGSKRRAEGVGVSTGLSGRSYKDSLKRTVSRGLS
jgi:hypothetical protein